MKTRLISFLLLLVLIVTSIPMSALSFVSFAEETEGENTTSTEMTEEQYNALYVQDGLLYSIDFYKLNKYWGDRDYPVPQYSAEGYEDESEAFSVFLEADKKFFSNFNNTPESSLSFHTEKQATHKLSAIDTDLGEGFVTVLNTTNNKRVLILEGATAGQIKTFEMVSLIPTANVTGITGTGRILQLNGLLLTVHGTNFYISGVSGITVSLTTPNKHNSGYRPPYDKVSTVTYEMDGIPNDSYDGTFRMYNGSKLISSVSYSAPTALNKIGYNGYGDGIQLYALRYYSDVLTEGERAQNHFADIAKFFKLDVSKFVEKRDGLSVDEKNAYYGAFAGVTVESEFADVMAALEAANKLILTEEELARDHFDKIVAKFDLNVSKFEEMCDSGDLDGVQIMEYYNAFADVTVESELAAVMNALDAANKGILGDEEYAQNHFENIVDFFSLGISKFTDVLGYLNDDQIKAYYAAFADVTFTSTQDEANAALEAANSDLPDKSELELKAELDYYNSLYVQDGLLYSIDFYKLNEHWSPNGHGYVVPTLGDGEDLDDFIDRDAAFFSQFNNTPDSTLSFHTEKNNNYQASAIDPSLGKGFVTIINTTSTRRALILENATAGQIQTFEMVSKVGSSINKNLFQLNSFIPAMTQKTDLGITTFVITGNNGGTITLGSVTNEDTNLPRIDKVTTITYTMDISQSIISMYNGSVKLMNAPYTGTLGAVNKIGVSGWADDAELYALRYYDVVLTEDQCAQNHFADLAKFFRLNLEGFDSLDDTQKAGIYTALASYSVGESTQDEVQLAYDNAVKFETAKKGLITFDGYQAKLQNYPGIRSVYFISKDAIKEIEDLGYNVIVGAIMAPKTADRDTHEEVFVPTNEAGNYDRTGYNEISGNMYMHNDLNAAYLEVYSAGAVTEGTSLLNPTIEEGGESVYKFAFTTVYEGDLTAERVEREFIYRGFYVITDENGDTVAIGYADMTSENFGDSISIYELSKYINENDYEGNANNDQILNVINTVDGVATPEVTAEATSTETPEVTPEEQAE